MQRISGNYIISKNRAQKQVTHNAMVRAGIPHSIVIERGQYDAYRKALPDVELLVIDGDDLGVAHARNACLDFAKQQEKRVCWIWDDDVSIFQRDTVSETGNWKFCPCKKDYTECWARVLVKSKYSGVHLSTPQFSFKQSRPAACAHIGLGWAYGIDILKCRLRYDESFGLCEDMEWSIRFFLSGFSMLEIYNFTVTSPDAGKDVGGNYGLRESGEEAVALGRLMDAYGRDYFKKNKATLYRPVYSKFAAEGERRAIEKWFKESCGEVRF